MDTVVNIGLPENFVSFIWQCITTSRMQVMWNEEA